MLEIFKLLANAKRLAILDTLHSRGTLSAGEIADAIGHSQPCTSQYLVQMERAELLRSARMGVTVFYCINPKLNWPIEVFHA